MCMHRMVRCEHRTIWTEAPQVQKTRIGRSDVYAPDGLVYAPDGVMCTPDNLDRGTPKTKIHAPDGPVCTDRTVRCVRKVYVSFKIESNSI